MGGSITLQSEQDKGSTFSFAVTFKCSATPSNHPESVASPAINKPSKRGGLSSTSEPLRGLKLLVVEDNLSTNSSPKKY